MTEESGSERPDGELESYVPGTPAGTGGGDGEAPRRRKATTVAVGIGVVVAMVAGVAALATLNSDGGSGTPEAAVRKMADAVANEDVLGALDALVPGERAVMRDRLFEITAELGRLGLLEDKVDLGHVPGADLSIEGLELTTEPLSDDVAAVLVTGGTAGLKVTPADLPAGPVVRDLIDAPDTITDTTPLGNDDDVRVVTVREGGDWFVSLGYTWAEAIRRDSDAGELQPDKAVSPKGAATPEAAVEEFARAAADLDARRLVELAAPGEAAALQTYAPLFLEEATQWADDIHADGVKATIDQLELSSKESGDVAQVKIERLAVGLSTRDTRSVYTFDGECFRFEEPDPSDEPDESDASNALCRTDENFSAVERTMFEGFTLTVVRHDGAWYISPIGTQLDTTLAALRSLDRAEIEAAFKENEDPGVIAGAVAPMFQLAVTLFFRVAFGSYGDEQIGECVTTSQDPAEESPAECQEGVPVPPPTAVATTGPPPVPPGRSPVTNAIGQAPVTAPATEPGAIGAKPVTTTSDPTRDPPALPLVPSTTTP